MSAKAEIAGRFVSFFRSLRTAPSHEVVCAALLTARDARTTLGKNISYLERLSGQDVWAASPTLVRTTIMERETVAPPPEDAWRLPFLSKLLEQREKLHWMGMDKEEEKVQELIDSLCKS